MTMGLRVKQVWMVNRYSFNLVLAEFPLALRGGGEEGEGAGGGSPRIDRRSRGLNVPRFRGLPKVIIEK